MKSGKPVISIVLPVYNGERYLASSIESILKQSFKLFELIIVDDCSNDCTSEIIKTYKKKDPRIIGIRNSVNLKLPKSLNAGFMKAKGEYFTWTSHDNLVHCDYLKELIGVIEKDDVDVVYSDFNKIDENGDKIGIERMEKSESLICGKGMGACFLYRKEVQEKLGGYDTSTFIYEDYDFWVRAYFYGFKFKKIDKLIYDYRIHSASLSSVHKVVDGWILYRFSNLDRYKNIDRKIKLQAYRGLLIHYRRLGILRSLNLLWKIIVTTILVAFE